MPDLIIKKQDTGNIAVSTTTQNVVIQATPTNSYVLPPATANTLGGVIIGSNLSITGNGVLSANIPPGGVESFNNRTGAITLTANDVTAVANGIYQANGSYLTDNITPVIASYGSDSVRGMRKGSIGAFGNFVAGAMYAGSYGMVGMVFGNEVSGVEFNLGDVFNTLRFRSYNKSIVLANDGFFVESGTANWSWSANTILTQGRGDARYQATGNYLTSANLTWGNITGKPTFANVATSGNYTDLANTPNLSLYLTTANAASTYLPSANFTYANISGTIPTATNSTLGAIKVGSNLTIANGVLSANVPAGSGGFQNGDILNGGTF